VEKTKKSSSNYFRVGEKYLDNLSYYSTIFPLFNFLKIKKILNTVFKEFIPNKLTIIHF